MERLYTHYTAEGRQIVLNNVPASFASITTENIRLIFNETQKDAQGDALDPLASTGAKENITNVIYDGTAKTVTITLADTVPAIVSGDDITIKLDMGEGFDDVITITAEIDTTLLALESTTAKQGINPNVTLTGVDTKIGDLTDIIEAINGDTVDDIVNGYLDGEAEEIMSIIGDWSEQESES